MRPSLSEHLSSLRRILAEEVAPALSDDYSREILDGVVKSMAMLAATVDNVASFLAWDNEHTAALLAAIEPHVELGARGDVSGSGLFSDGDVDEHPERENERLRALLARAIGPLAAREDTALLYGQVVAHLRERINRYPYTSTASLPSK